jgi:mRNA-degrading endonuclease RelE of RelBE toxin-antitoxin system
VTYRVRFTPAADEDVAAIQDTRTRSAVVRRAYALNTEPVAQGKPLQKDLRAPQRASLGSASKSSTL